MKNENVRGNLRHLTVCWGPGLSATCPWHFPFNINCFCHSARWHCRKVTDARISERRARSHFSPSTVVIVVRQGRASLSNMPGCFLTFTICWQICWGVHLKKERKPRQILYPSVNVKVSGRHFYIDLFTVFDLVWQRYMTGDREANTDQTIWRNISALSCYIWKIICIRFS